MMEELIAIEVKKDMVSAMAIALAIMPLAQQVLFYETLKAYNKENEH